MDPSIPANVSASIKVMFAEAEFSPATIPKTHHLVVNQAVIQRPTLVPLDEQTARELEDSEPPKSYSNVHPRPPRSTCGQLE